MGARRPARDGKRSVVVGLDVARCLDTAGFLVRNAGRYGIDGDLEFRRSRSVRLPDRHYVLGRRPARRVAVSLDDLENDLDGDLDGAPVAANRARPLWIVQLTVRPEALDGERTEVTVSVHRDSGWRPWWGPGRSAETYQALLTEALVRLDRRHGGPRRARPWPDNVVALRPLDRIPPTASA